MAKPVGALVSGSVMHTISTLYGRHFAPRPPQNIEYEHVLCMLYLPVLERILLDCTTELKAEKVGGLGKAYFRVQFILSARRPYYRAVECGVGQVPFSGVTLLGVFNWPGRELSSPLLSLSGLSYIGHVEIGISRGFS